jgi:hypothetical protein
MTATKKQKGQKVLSTALPVTIEPYNPEVHGDFASNPALVHQCHFGGMMFVAKMVAVPDAPPEIAERIVGRICIFPHSVYTTEIFHAHAEPEVAGRFVVKQLYQHVLNLINTPIIVTGAWLEHERLQRTLSSLGFTRVAQIFSRISNRQVICYAKVNDPATRVDASGTETIQQSISARPTIHLPEPDEDDTDDTRGGYKHDA